MFWYLFQLPLQKKIKLLYLANSLLDIDLRKFNYFKMIKTQPFFNFDVYFKHRNQDKMTE